MIKIISNKTTIPIYIKCKSIRIKIAKKKSSKYTINRSKKNIFNKLNSNEQICPICCLEFNKIDSDLVITSCCQNIFHLSCFTKSLFDLKLKCPFCVQNLKIKECSIMTNKISENEKKKIMINSYKKHLEKFSWQKNALETQKIYEELLWVKEL